MYLYSEFDHAFLTERNRQFRAQVARRLDGSLTEDEFKPLRLMNGVYLQLHAYMLRAAIPYGTLNGAQMRKLAEISERWDRGYGHFTTRQNIQFNWPALADIPEMLDALAEVGMHALQTSGNTIRNVTTDQFAGAAADELADPRPYAEVIRQWSTDHPEFQFLPRKFKIAITGSPNDRAATKAHDIGLRMHRNAQGELGFEVIVGGGLGRTPMVGKVLRDWISPDELLPYLESAVRVWNLIGRRDNKYKARIKILIHEMGVEAFREKVDADFAARDRTRDPDMERALAGIKSRFRVPDLAPELSQPLPANAAPGFGFWLKTNTHAHKVPGWRSVTVSLKKHGAIPGDASTDQMRLLAELAETYGQDELRISHEQNVILPHIREADLAEVYAALNTADLATANAGLVSDIIACPGMDYCALATARSIPVAQEISTRFSALKAEHDIGPLKIKISGCINACGHHHIGHIGILGLERAGVETYQITLGGDGTETMVVGEKTGAGFSSDEIVPAIERLIATYLDARQSREETFLEAFRRMGPEPFKAALYYTEAESHAA